MRPMSSGIANVISCAVVLRQCRCFLGPSARVDGSACWCQGGDESGETHWLGSRFPCFNCSLALPFPTSCYLTCV